MAVDSQPILLLLHLAQFVEGYLPRLVERRTPVDASVGHGEALLAVALQREVADEPHLLAALGEEVVFAGIRQKILRHGDKVEVKNLLFALKIKEVADHGPHIRFSRMHPLVAQDGLWQHEAREVGAVLHDEKIQQPVERLLQSAVNIGQSLAPEALPLQHDFLADLLGAGRVDFLELGIVETLHEIAVPRRVVFLLHPLAQVFEKMALHLFRQRVGVEVQRVLHLVRWLAVLVFFTLKMMPAVVAEHRGQRALLIAGRALLGLLHDGVAAAVAELRAWDQFRRTVWTELHGRQFRGQK